MGIRLVSTQIACVVVAVLLWLLRVDDRFLVGLVFSLIIGNACWLLIDGGREAAAAWRRSRGIDSGGWPGWAWMAPIVVLGTLIGYTGGYEIAVWLLGLKSSKNAVYGPVLLVSLAAAVAVTYYFYAHETLLSRRLEAEAAQRLASETQLKLLQSQLEPHMLFNTLANLRVLIEMDPPAAQAMLDHLIRFLRNTLASTRIESHPLAAEFDAIADYLALMAVRMGPRLQSTLELPADLRELPLPPLLLQPLVENAIKHGLEPQVGGGRLLVQARREVDRLRLTVQDSGMGLGGLGASGAGAGAAAGGGTASAAAPASAGTGFGLTQVRQRLAQRYGAAARLTIEPAEGGGTRVEVVMPCPVR